MKNEGGDSGYVTESISDFMPLAQTSGGDFADADNPSWFGTANCSDSELAVDRITDGIVICNDYAILNYDVEEKKCNDASLWARDYYASTGDKIENTGCKNIGDFVIDRQATESPLANGATGLNYLSLTNIVNPAMFKDYDNKEDMAKLYFRVETYDDKTVRETAEIISDGYAGNSKQSIKVMKQRDSYMPVFNFSIYSTYGSTEGSEKYYYDNKPKLEISG